jgi:hypothetical protein
MMGKCEERFRLAGLTDSGKLNLALSHGPGDETII